VKKLERIKLTIDESVEKLNEMEQPDVRNMCKACKLFLVTDYRILIFSILILIDQVLLMSKSNNNKNQNLPFSNFVHVSVPFFTLFQSNIYGIHRV
jgi:hypothetical protein